MGRGGGGAEEEKRESSEWEGHDAHPSAPETRGLATHDAGKDPPSRPEGQQTRH